MEDNPLDEVSESIREKMKKQFHMAGEKVKMDLSLSDVDETAVEIDNLVSLENDVCIIEVCEQDVLKASASLFHQLRQFIDRVLITCDSIDVCEISGGGMRMRQVCDLIKSELNDHCSCKISINFI